MSKPKPPVPLPRRLPPAVKPVKEEVQPCSAPPQCPTHGSEKQVEDSHKNEYVEILKSHPPNQPPSPPPSPPPNRAINAKVEFLYKAIQEYKKQMCEHGGTLKNLITELRDIASNLNKVSGGTKIAGITGGASTVAGGVAAAAGVILCPFTAGASLALTAVGVGVAAAGGVTGASAAIANKANLTQDRKKIDKTLQEFDGYYGNVINCLKYINESMELLKEHSLSELNATAKFSKKAAKVVKLVSEDASVMSSENSSKANGFIKGFAVAMDFYFIEGKEGAKVKKGLESKLAKKLLTLADDLDEGLNELMKIKMVFEKLD